CAGTQECTNRNCCPMGQTYCDGGCVDTDTDNDHCGSCGMVCPDFLGLVGVCDGAGECALLWSDDVLPGATITPHDAFLAVSPRRGLEHRADTAEPNARPKPSARADEQKAPTVRPSGPFVLCVTEPALEPARA